MRLKGEGLKTSELNSSNSNVGPSSYSRELLAVRELVPPREQSLLKF